MLPYLLLIFENFFKKIIFVLIFPQISPEFNVFLYILMYALVQRIKTDAQSNTKICNFLVMANTSICVVF